jgi:hypothetical protein
MEDQMSSEIKIIDMEDQMSSEIKNYSTFSLKKQSKIFLNKKYILC